MRMYVFTFFLLLLHHPLQCVSQLAWTVATFRGIRGGSSSRTHPDRALLEALAVRSLQLLGKFKDIELAQLVGSLTEAGVKGPEGLYSALAAACVPCVHNMSPRTACTILRAFAGLVNDGAGGNTHSWEGFRVSLCVCGCECVQGLCG